MAEFFYKNNPCKKSVFEDKNLQISTDQQNGFMHETGLVSLCFNRTVEVKTLQKADNTLRLHRADSFSRLFHHW